MHRRCFFIGVGLNQGSVAQHFLALADELANRGHRLIILSWPPRPRIEAHDANPAIISWPSPRPTRIPDALFLHQLTRRFRPDCFISNFGSINIMTLVGAFHRVPARICWQHTLTEQITLDSGRLTVRQRFLIWQGGIILRLATHVAANSKASASDAQRTYRVPKQKCSVLYLSLADPGPNGHGLDRNDFNHRVVCAGRLERCKGQDVLIQAAAILKRKYVPFDIWFFGDGSTSGALRRLVANLGLANCCHFRGHQDRADVMRALAGAAISVVPSRSEGFGLICVESLAVGTPVVASRVGGIPEIVQDEAEGFLVPRENPQALAEAIERVLLSDSSVQQKLRQTARARFLSSFERRQVIPRQADWLEGIVSGQPDRERQ